MNSKKGTGNLRFLDGGGEMGRLTRAYDWSKTVLGVPETWSQSLRTTLSILLTSRFPMFLWWGPELICFYNDAYRPSLGKDGKHPGILGIRGEEAWPEIWDVIKPLIDQVLSGGESTWSENQLIPIYRNGRIEDVYWTFSYSPVHDEDGGVAGVLVTCNETTDIILFRKELERLVEQRTKELRQVNEVLARSEERYHLMVEEVQDYAILYLSPGGVVENWNKGAEKIKGYRAEEIIGKNFSSFYTKQDKDKGLPRFMLQQATDTGRAAQQGWRVRKDGSLFWASVVITAVHDSEGHVIGFSKVTHDLTQKKADDERLQEYATQLEQKNEELQYINKELQSFAYISSHDLQEPLRKIQTFSSLIIQKELERLSDEGRNIFKRLQSAAKRMQQLIDDLLAYSRTNTAERKYKTRHLKNIVDEVIEDFKDELKKKNATIEVDEMVEARIIAFQFHQLIYNLVGNALKFSVSGRPLHIKIKSKIAKGAALNDDRLAADIEYCHLRISDNGIGFEQKYSHQIFEVFQRLHGREQYEGTGIGLAIVKKIVENHNGIITAHGEPDKGATFDIYFPVGE